MWVLMQQFNGLKASPLFLLIKCQMTLTANELTPHHHC